DATLIADVYVSLPGPSASRASGTLPPDVVAAFVAHPDVESHSTYRGVDVVDADGTYRVMGLDLADGVADTWDFLDTAPGFDAASIMRAFRDGAGVWISEPFGFRRGLAAGDTVSIPSD